MKKKKKKKTFELTGPQVFKMLLKKGFTGKGEKNLPDFQNWDQNQSNGVLTFSTTVR